MVFMHRVPAPWRHTHTLPSPPQPMDVHPVPAPPVCALWLVRSIMEMDPNSAAFQRIFSNVFAYTAFKSTEPWLVDYVTLDLHDAMKQVSTSLAWDRKEAREGPTVWCCVVVSTRSMPGCARVGRRHTALLFKQANLPPRPMESDGSADPALLLLCSAVAAVFTGRL